MIIDPAIAADITIAMRRHMIEKTRLPIQGLVLWLAEDGWMGCWATVFEPMPDGTTMSTTTRYDHGWLNPDTTVN